MLFNSLQYLFFFPIVTSLYFLVPYRSRWALLLAASYFFYMSWVPAYAALIAASTLVTYAATRGIGASGSPLTRKFFLALSLAANLGILFVFKYYNFFNDSLGAGLPAIKVLLPIGVSFHTFQAVGYTIEVYRGNFTPERHLGIFSLYNCFFPQLVAGPIERPHHLLPQMHKEHAFEYGRVTDGLKLIAWGLFQKVVIADNLAGYVNSVYDQPEHYSGLPLLIATYLFAFQIYCDFAGYTDIAIGSARVMGFDLMENFERPYFARSIPEFWRRWHISLSTWFRDYIYIPLGGNRVSVPRLCANLLLVFFVCGLWHGASWTFVAWGGLHGMYMALSLLTRKWRVKAEGWAGMRLGALPVKALQVFFTFNLVCLGWVFFRAKTLGQAWLVISGIFSASSAGPPEENPARLAFYFGLVLLLLLVQYVQRSVRVRDYIIKKPLPLRFAGYALVVLATFFLGSFEGSDFIYFQF